MKKAFLILGFLTLLVACKNKSEFFFPINENAKEWIPNNQDSIKFVSTSGDSVYLIYNAYSTIKKKINEQTTREEITQKGYSTDSNFTISYRLTSGLPEQDSLGSATKTDVLRINTPGSSNYLNISTNSLSGDFTFLDSLVLNTNKVYYSVFTDNANHYFTATNGVIRFKSGATWFDKTN